MSASREHTGQSDSRKWMPPEVRAEALCDELRSGARPMDRTTNFCICAEVADAIRAAMIYHAPGIGPGNAPTGAP